MTIRSTIFGKVLGWLGITLGLSVVGLILTTAWVVSRAPQRPFPGRLLTAQLEDARRAYLEGGVIELSEELRMFQQQSPGQYNLVGREGHDLITGKDLSATVSAARTLEPPWRRKRGTPPSFWDMLSGSPMLKLSTPDGEFTLLAKPRATLDPWRILPYYLGVAVLVVLMGYALAMHFVKPIRELRTAVAQFGEGDLDHRMRSRRGDELGDLARDFDSMADRLQNLLVAERRLLQDVSHELRSPLARLGFAVELARSGNGAAFDRIKEEVSRLTALVGELLQVTRVEGDPAARGSQPVRLDEITAAIAEGSAIEAEARGCRIDHRADRPVVVSGDPELLHRAVENIVRNAIRHTADHTNVEVQVSQSGPEATIVVRDRGPGVPEPMLGDIFKPFFRVEDDRNRASGGTGLGLAIADRAIRAHGGRIEAANAGPGLRVTIALPVDAGGSGFPNSSLHKSRLPDGAGRGLPTRGHEPPGGDVEPVRVESDNSAT
ncbi:MAG: ATP-binding protein [Bryobacteraceae bacterium]